MSMWGSMKTYYCYYSDCKNTPTTQPQNRMVLVQLALDITWIEPVSEAGERVSGFAILDVTPEDFHLWAKLC